MNRTWNYFRALESASRGLKYFVLNYLNIGVDDIIYALKSQEYGFDAGIDVGAATGDWSNAMHRHLGLREIIAFEPSERFYFSTLIAIFPIYIRRQIKLHKSIVTSRPRNKYLITHERGRALHYRAYSSPRIEEHQQGIFVRTTKLSELRLKGTKILLKIDVEGNEFDVMKSGDAVFYSKVHAIVFELNPTEEYQASLNHIRDFLCKFGFEIYVCSENKFFPENRFPAELKRSVNLIALKSSA